MLRIISAEIHRRRMRSSPQQGAMQAASSREAKALALRGKESGSLSYLLLDAAQLNPRRMAGQGRP